MKSFSLFISFFVLFLGLSSAPLARGAVLFSDDFTNTDATPLTTHNACYTLWVGDGDIYSNELVADGTLYTFCDDDTTTLPTNHYSEIGFVYDSTWTGSIGTGVRYTDNANDPRYQCYVSLTTLELVLLRKNDGAGSTEIASRDTSLTLYEDDYNVLTATADGDSITCNLNGTDEISATDSNLTGTGAFILLSTGISITDWEVGDLTVEPTPTTEPTTEPTATPSATASSSAGLSDEDRLAIADFVLLDFVFKALVLLTCGFFIGVWVFKR